jgi:Phospholipase_D-nuclease N-terminal
MLGTDYPALGLFWTMLELAVFVLWVWLIIVIIRDIFRSADLSGGMKALWTFLVIILPWVGIVIYLVVRGRSMSQRWSNGHRPVASGDVYSPPTALSPEPMAGGGISDPRPM